MLIVSLDVLGAKLELAVLVEVNVSTGDNGTWAERIGDTVPCWEAVQPEHTVVDELRHHHSGNLVEQHGVEETPLTFLDGADVQLGFRDVFAPGDCVQRHSEIGHFASDALKLSVHEHCLGDEAPLLVDVVHFAHGLDQDIVCLICNQNCRPELDVSGDRDEKCQRRY